MKVRTAIVSLFFLQMYILPQRYYSLAWEAFWPLTHNIPILLCLTCWFIFTRTVPPRATPGPLRNLLYSLAFFMIVQIVGIAVQSSTSNRPEIDILVYFISFFGPILSLAVSYFFSSTRQALNNLTAVFLATASLAVFVSWVFMFSDTAFGMAQVADGRKNFMYRLFDNKNTILTASYTPLKKKQYYTMSLFSEFLLCPQPKQSIVIHCWVGGLK